MAYLKDQLEGQIANWVKTKGWNADQWIVEIPKDRSVGDYATNLAFLLARELKKPPPLIAQELSVELETHLRHSFSKNLRVEALRGFMNIKFEAAYIFDYLTKKDFARNLRPSKASILLEYVSANPTGPLHIGHGRWAVLGDCLKRLLEKVGGRVITEFYVNDAGNQIQNLLSSVNARREGVAIPEDGYAGAYVQDLINKPDPIQALLDQQVETLASFGVKFDRWYREKENLHDTGAIEKALATLRKKKFLYEDGGALFFRSTDFGDDKDRVLIKADGQYTYFAADIAYHFDKVRRGFHHLINIWGADHHGYIKRVQAALKALVDDEAQLEVLLGQLVSLYRDGEEVRMSKRTGDMITLAEVIDEIGVDAARFFLIMKPADTPLDFDLALAVSKSNDNPVYYVQYAHARICSIESKSAVKPVFSPDIKLTEIEIKLIKFLASFEDELVTAAARREPHRMATYLIECANLFHTFYHQCKVNVEDERLAANRMAIIEQVRRILAMGLELLGLTAPRKM